MFPDFLPVGFSCYKNSKVRIRKGAQTAWIGYDDKLIKVRSAAGAKTPPRRQSAMARKRPGPPIPGGINPARAGTGKKHAPRTRYVPRNRRR